jgi:hypothetical protein
MTKYQPRWPSWRVRPCGTEAAYVRHRRRGEPVDQACREAAARARQGRRWAAWDQPIPWTLIP